MRFITHALISPHIRFLIIFLLAILGEIHPANSQEVNAQPNIKALLITGGSGNDFVEQEIMIKNGLNKRCRIPIIWTNVRYQKKSDHTTLETDKDPWAGEYDIIIHHDSLPEVDDTDWFEKILRPHKQSIPGIVIHRTGHRPTEEENLWVLLTGVETESTQQIHALDVETQKTRHQVTDRLSNWTTAKERLIEVSSILPTATVLANTRSKTDQEIHPVIWTNQYTDAQTRIFNTSLGLNDETFEQTEYLDMLASGLLWALDKSIRQNQFSSLINVETSAMSLRPGRNLLTNATTDSSSTQSSDAIDGDPDTAWKSGKGDIINWWQGNFEEPTELSAIAIIWQEPSNFPYWVEGSLDGQIWTKFVDNPAAKIERKISFHELDATYRHLRISNPQTGVVASIAEVAAYKSLRHTPTHLISAAFQPEKQATQIHVQTDSTPDPPLDLQQAWATLDEYSDSQQIAAAFETLGKTYQADVVQKLTARINQTRSGHFRHLGIDTLGNLYRNPDEQTWSQSPIIAKYLETLFTEKRIDKKRLIKTFTRNNIEISDITTVINRLGYDPKLHQVLLKLFKQNRVPYNGLSMLSKILKDDSESMQNRIKAATLLVKTSDMLAMRDGFEFAANIENLSKDIDQLKSNVIANPTWESQTEWLIEKGIGNSSMERTLAWRIIIAIRADADTRPENLDLINEAISNSEKRAAASFVTLLNVIAQTDEPDLLKLVNRAKSSRSKKVSSAAIQSQPTTSLTDSASMTLNHFSIDEIRIGVSTISAPDPKAGEFIYRKNCTRCHNQLAPFLVDLENHDLFIDILTPVANIKKGFATIELTMTNNNVYSGWVAQESTDELLLIDRGGNQAILEKDNIRLRQIDPISTMPQNVVDHLTTNQFANLLAYLKSR